MSEVFYCYSPTLHKELMSIGEKYIAKTVNPSTNRECWLFLYNENLTNYLNNRPKQKHKYKDNCKNPKFD